MRPSGGGGGRPSTDGPGGARFTQGGHVNLNLVAEGHFGDSIVAFRKYFVELIRDGIGPCTVEAFPGMRNAQGGWADSGKFILGIRQPMEFSPENTTIGVVMTDAALTVDQANIVAMMAHDGIARATRPS